MRIFELNSDAQVARRTSDVFPFFSDAFNLERLTPPWLRFQVVTPGPIRMQVGTRIEYRLRLRGVPIRWISEIKAWEPPYRFVDRQVTGPYRLWIHEHRFRDSENGAICEDTVRYAVWGGALVNWLAVGTDVKRIFDYRREKLLEIFGSGGEHDERL